MDYLFNMVIFSKGTPSYALKLFFRFHRVTPDNNIASDILISPYLVSIARDTGDLNDANPRQSPARIYEILCAIPVI